MVDYTPQMTSREKNNATILIVEKETDERNHLKNSLKHIGFDNINDATDDSQAIEKINHQDFTHVIFNANELSCPINDFISNLLQIKKDIIVIPCLSDTDIDYIFNLMIHGARGFIVKPFSYDAIESTITMASKGDPINSLVLKSKNRNEALIAIIMTSVDNMSNIVRQAKQFETAKREIPKYFANIKNAVALAHTFAKDGDDGLLQSLLDFFQEKVFNASERGKHKTHMTN